MILAAIQLNEFWSLEDNDNNNDITITTPTTTITITAQDFRMLKGIKMMMIVLLMKVCIESRRNISFVFSFSWITTEGISLQQH